MHAARAGAVPADIDRPFGLRGVQRLFDQLSVPLMERIRAPVVELVVRSPSRVLRLLLLFFVRHCAPRLCWPKVAQHSRRPNTVRSGADLNPHPQREASRARQARQQTHARANSRTHPASHTAIAQAPGSAFRGRLHQHTARKRACCVHPRSQSSQTHCAGARYHRARPCAAEHERMRCQTLPRLHVPPHRPTDRPGRDSTALRVRAIRT
jgi:hypothetical protein